MTRQVSATKQISKALKQDPPVIRPEKTDGNHLCKNRLPNPLWNGIRSVWPTSMLVIMFHHYHPADEPVKPEWDGSKSNGQLQGPVVLRRTSARLASPDHPAEQTPKRKRAAPRGTALSEFDC